MPEEMSAKLKPRLDALDPDTQSMIVVTRERVVQDVVLFEQSLLGYAHLTNSLAAGQYASVFDVTDFDLSSHSSVAAHADNSQCCKHWPRKLNGI